MAKRKETVEHGIKELQLGQTTLFVLGTSKLVMNRMAKKALEELLLPKRTMNKAARQQTLKHNPPEEFRASIYRCRDHAAPALIHLPTNSFKKAMAQAALDMEGATKAEVGRLITIVDETVHVFGKPFLFMSPVRLAGFTKVPDIRTRAALPQWACKLTVQFVRSKIREQDIANLMGAAGHIVGVGDGRTEKGTYNWGSWKIVEANDPDWQRIVKQQARKVQEAAMAQPEALDEDTEELLAYFHTEIIRRERDDQPSDVPAARRPRVAANKANGVHSFGEVKRPRARAQAA